MLFLGVEVAFGSDHRACPVARCSRLVYCVDTVNASKAMVIRWFAIALGAVLLFDGPCVPGHGPWLRIRVSDVVGSKVVVDDAQFLPLAAAR